MKKTPLNEMHRKLGAKMVDFGGWDMPLQYTSIQEETAAVRNNVGMFDVSHMGELIVRGEKSGEFLDWALTRPITDRKPDQVAYAILCYEDGGVVDDLLVYHMDQEYLLIVNASNTDKDFDYLQEVCAKWQKKHGYEKDSVILENKSSLYGQIAIQGRNALEIMEKILPKMDRADMIDEVKALKNYRQTYRKVEGEGAYLIISKTGYTGEEGYEVYCPASQTTKWWEALAAEAVTPCGLGARDALRLEAGMPLYGHEMNKERNPLNANMQYAIKQPERDFLGKAMMDHHDKKLLGVISEGRAIAREEYKVFADGEEVGIVASGSYSPTLEKGIATIFVPLDLSDDIETFEIEIHKKKQPFKKVDMPFVKGYKKPKEAK